MENNNIFTHEEELFIENEYKSLINDYLNSNHRRKVELIDKAFKLAYRAHYGVRRRSGEPYILHPIAVARIVCREIGLGSTSICSALLHDVVEDTDYTVEDLNQLFGEKISSIVDGLTKISNRDSFSSNTSMQAENFRKIILTMNDDVRVILIKIADRLHNMRTLASMLPAKQYKIAGETLYVYAPLAHRLGLFAIKSELEDLCFRYEHPDKYRELEKKILESQDKRNTLFEEFAEPLRKRFDQMGFIYEMKSRLKTSYSIWRKMEKKNIPFDEIYDLYAVRIIFETSDNYPDKNRCWDIYTAITDIYKNRPDRIRDWVSNPKSNGYQALHLTVMGPSGNWVEVQIRSRKMDDIAEKGFAAHWKYKEDGVEEDSELDKWLKTIREILENPSPNAMDFLDTIKLNLYSNDIMIFTPKGDNIKLANGATVLDFAYAVHSDLGDKCIGAKVNHKIVPPSHVLSSGDQVEVLTSNKAMPNENWLSFIVTAKARYMIDLALKKRDKQFIKEGEDIVKMYLESGGQEVSLSLYDRVASVYGYTKRDEFFLNVGNGKINLVEDLQKAKEFNSNKKTGFLTRILSSVFNSKNKINEKNVENAVKINNKNSFELRNYGVKSNYLIAKCCNPISGDDVLGVINNDDIVEVHLRSCPYAMKLKSSVGDKLLDVYWGNTENTFFEASMSFKGIDSHGVMFAIGDIMTNELKLNIKEVSIKAKDGIFEGKIIVMVHSTEDVDNICKSLQKSKSVLSINRIMD